jgi:S1-C subfamily serine protease
MTRNRALTLGRALLTGLAANLAPGRDLLSQVDVSQMPRKLEAARSATVSISARSQKGTVTGSGFVVDGAGIVVTAAHVVGNATQVEIRLPSGQSMRAAGLLHTDSATDLAILKLDATGLASVPLGNTDSLRIGQRLYAIGSPLGLELTLSDGLLSAQRLINGRRLLQISIPVSPGSSGGPVLNDDGEAVGLVVSGIRGGGAENLNFALPVSYVREVLPLVRGQQPLAFTGGENSGVEVASANGGSPVPAAVNKDLGFDWSVLDGVELFSEEEPQKDWRTRTTTRYSNSIDPMGKPTSERVQTVLWEYKKPGMFGSWTAQVREDTRMVIPRVAGQSWDLFWTRAPFVPTPQFPRALSSRLTLSDSVLTYSPPTGHAVARRDVPRGVVPILARGASIAALPDSLPNITYVWEVAVDTSGASVLPVKVEVLERRSIRVHMPARGGHCGPDAKTEDLDVSALHLQITSGASSQQEWVSAARPHVLLNVACVKLPWR